jgi:hypothetical protein
MGTGEQVSTLTHGALSQGLQSNGYSQQEADDLAGGLEIGVHLAAGFGAGRVSGIAPKMVVGKSELGNALSDLGTNPLGRNLNRLEEFGQGAGFSGVIDVESAKFLAYASGETKLANGATPLNLVEQIGGHQDVNAALSRVLGNTSANRLGFSMVLDAEGNFAVKFNSGINSANPNVLVRTVPESMRQQILDAISKSTGRKAYSAQ